MADLGEATPHPVIIVSRDEVPTLAALVRMKLTSFRLKDRVHLLDMLEVGLIDDSWHASLQPELAARLQEIIDSRTAEG